MSNEKEELDTLWQRIYADKERAQLLTVGLLAREIRQQHPTSTHLVLVPSDDRPDGYWPSELLDFAGNPLPVGGLGLNDQWDAWVHDLEVDGDWTMYLGPPVRPHYNQLLDLVAAALQH